MGPAQSNVKPGRIRAETRGEGGEWGRGGRRSRTNDCFLGISCEIRAGWWAMGVLGNANCSWPLVASILIQETMTSCTTAVAGEGAGDKGNQKSTRDIRRSSERRAIQAGAMSRSKVTQSSGDRRWRKTFGSLRMSSVTFRKRSSAAERRQEG